MVFVKIINPIDGAILNRHDGVVSEEGLRVSVTGTVEPGSGVQVNGIKAEVEGDHFTVEVTLKDKKIQIQALARKGDQEAICTISVLWDKDSIKRYQFSTDDNIEFLKDIAQNTSIYRSIFDNNYMRFWREKHERYGVKMHHNIYFQTEGFNLSQMSDKFKSEWQDNADWLRLSFHSLEHGNKAPYTHSTYEEVTRDFKLVTNEIIRFAGEELLSPFTTIHWGNACREACRALRDNGITGLMGEFPLTKYYLNEEASEYLGKHDYWKDIKEDIFFISADILLDFPSRYPNVAEHLDKVAANPYQQEVMQLFVHEWSSPWSKLIYVPKWFEEKFRQKFDYKERVNAALKWVTSNGYKSVFYDEGFLGAPE